MITELRLINFKSFVDETIPFSNFSLILGANGAGKSNLFDALRFLKSIGQGRSVRDAVEGHAFGSQGTYIAGIRGGGQAATHYNSSSRTFELRVSMIFPGDIKGPGDSGEDPEDFVVDYAIEINATSYRVVNESLSSTNHPGPYVFSTRPETGPLDNREEFPALSARFYKATRGLNPKREFSPFDFILSQFVSRRAESRLNEEIADLAREELASIAPLELQPDVLRRYSPLGRFELGEHGENFAAAMWRLNREADHPVDYERVGPDDEYVEVYDEGAVGRRDAVLAWLSEVTPRRISELRTPESPTGEVIFAVREEPYEGLINAPSLSDGTLRFAALSLAAVGRPGRQTLVVEELENGINPVRIALLLKMLTQVTAARPECQVIASTHSPALLDYADERTVDNTVVIGWNDDLMSSHAVVLKDLPGLQEARETQSLGDLQEEGWLQLSAGI